MVHAIDAARLALHDDEALVFDWHRVAICCPAAGEVSLAGLQRTARKAAQSFRKLGGELAVYVHRMAYADLARREITIDCVA